MNNKEVYEAITDQILECLEQGMIPWERPWSADRPRSISTGNNYSGTNHLLLEAERMINEYSSPFWGTFNQINKHDGQVCSGESATKIIFCKPVERFECQKCGELANDKEAGEEHVNDEHEEAEEDHIEETTIPLLMYYNVFNLDQTTLTEEDLSYESETAEGADEKREAEDIITDFEDRPEIIHGARRAYYHPRKDEVHVPGREDFKGTDSYYFTLFHELTHSTGHEKRLDRQAVSEMSHFADEEYSREELVAELGGSFLGHEAGLDTEKKIDNRAAYIQSWKQKLEEDERAVVKASTTAQEAVDYILGKSD